MVRDRRLWCAPSPWQCLSSAPCSPVAPIALMGLIQFLPAWLGPSREACARGGIAPAGTVGRDGRILQSRVVVAVDHPLDLAAVDADVLERAVIERAKLAHRRVALAAQRVGAPPSACRRGDRPGSDA